MTTLDLTCQPLITKADVTKVLESLGENPAIISQTLIGKGVKGICEEEGQCVIAQYLVEQFPGYMVSVTACEVDFFHGITDEHLVVPLNNFHSDFIEKFDNGHYPSLIQHIDNCDGTWRKITPTAVLIGRQQQNIEAHSRIVCECGYSFLTEHFGKGEQTEE